MKNKIRKEIKEKIKSIQNKDQQSIEMSKKLFNNEDFVSTNDIFAFVSLQDEISTLQIINQIIKLNKNLYLPRVKEDSMDFYLIDNNKDLFEQLEKNQWNIYEPKTNLKKVNFNTDKNLKKILILVPGLAFTKTGKRLGRGKGFYDKFFTTIPQNIHTIKVGLCYNIQILSDLPTEKHDILMDYVIL